MALLKKSSIVGVSVTPEVGLEVAQIDFATQTVLKYGIRQLAVSYTHLTLPTTSIV